MQIEQIFSNLNQYKPLAQ